MMTIEVLHSSMSLDVGRDSLCLRSHSRIRCRSSGPCGFAIARARVLHRGSGEGLVWVKQLGMQMVRVSTHFRKNARNWSLAKWGNYHLRALRVLEVATGNNRDVQG